MGRLGIVAVGLALVVGVVASACGGGNGEQVAGHYENTELGFAFDYPEDWERLAPSAMEELLGGAGKTFASISFGMSAEEADILNGIRVSVHPLPQAVTEDEFFESVNLMYAMAAEDFGGAVEDEGWTQLGGRRARRYVISWPAEEVPLTTEHVTILRGGLQYELQCEAERARFEGIRTGCQVVHDSFEFTSEQ